MRHRGHEHKVNPIQCYEKITCEDKIHLAQVNNILRQNLSSEPKFQKRKYEEVKSYLETIPKSSADKVKLLLITRGIQSAFSSEKQNTSQSQKDKKRLQSLLPFLEVYQNSFEELDKFVDRMGENKYSV